MLILGLIINILISIGIANMWSNRGRSFAVGLLISIFTSWIVSLIIILVMGEAEKTKTMTPGVKRKEIYNSTTYEKDVFGYLLNSENVIDFILAKDVVMDNQNKIFLTYKGLYITELNPGVRYDFEYFGCLKYKIVLDEVKNVTYTPMDNYTLFFIYIEGRKLSFKIFDENKLFNFLQNIRKHTNFESIDQEEYTEETHTDDKDLIGKKAYNSINGFYMGIIVDETDGGNSWVIKSDSGYTNVKSKSKIDIRDQ